MNNLKEASQLSCCLDHVKFFCHICLTKSFFSCRCICLSQILLRPSIILAIFVRIYVEYVRSTCELSLSSASWNSKTSN